MSNRTEGTDVVEFNANDHVWVRLTARGREVHRANWQARANATWRPGMPVRTYTPPHEDAEGWSRWQLWGLMSEFGEYLSPGLPEPFEMRIRLALSVDSPAVAQG